MITTVGFFIFLFLLFIIFYFIFYFFCRIFSMIFFLIAKAVCNLCITYVWFFFKDFIYLFMRNTERRHRERGRSTGRGRSRLHAGSPMWDWIPGPRDHDLNQRQMLNHWAILVSLLCTSRFWFPTYLLGNVRLVISLHTPKLYKSQEFGWL